MFKSFLRHFWKRSAAEDPESNQHSEQLPEAREHYEQFLRYHDNGELELAWDEITRANQIDPGYAGSFVYLGQAYENRGELTKAAHAYKEFVRLAGADQNRGRFEQVLGQYPALIVALEKRAADQTTRGHLSVDQQKALFLTPTELFMFASGLRGLTGIEKDTGAWRSVTIPADVARWATPFAERIRQAEDLFKAQKLVDALAQFKELQESVPDAAIVLMNIGVYYAEIGNKHAAESWFRKALLSVPKEFRDRVEANVKRLNSDS